MTKREAANITVFAVFVSLLVVNILFFLGLFDAFSSGGRENIFRVLSQIVCMGVFPYFLYKRLSGDDNVLKTCMFTPLPAKTTGKTVLISVMFVFVNLGVALISFIILEALGYTFPRSDPTPMTNGYALFFQLVMVACLPSIFEEFVFRGIVLNAYRDKGPFVAIFVSALLFSFMHANIGQMLFTFVGGLVLGALAYKTGSIVAPMILHFCVNAFSVFASFASQNPDGVFAIVFNIVAIVFTNLISIIIMFILVAVFLNNWKNPKYPALDKARTPLTGYAFLCGALVVGALMNGVTFYWGLLR
jgi:membrane protease YdiL (CAAX protease family)